MKQNFCNMKNMVALWLWMLFALLPLSVSAQTLTVSGNVTDDTGEPVMVKGSRSGTITGLEGNFSLGVPSDAKRLEVSFTGSYKTVEWDGSGFNNHQ